MRRYSFFAAVLLSISILVSCSKGSAVEELNPQPQEPEIPKATLPYISFGKPATKVMMNNDDLHYAGNRIRVYDILTGFEGTIPGWSNGSGTYINDEIVYNGETIWPYTNNHLYPWTETGTHKFFGWLSYDKKANINVINFANPTLNPTTLVATVPAISFKTTTDQFDFMYSNLETRDAADRVYTAVPLTFKHLFTALCIQISNEAGVPIRITDLKFNDIKNKNNATIAFAETSTVSLGTGTVDGQFLPAFPSPYVELANGKKYDVLADQLNPSKNNYYMLWPLMASEVGAIVVNMTFEYYIEGEGWVEQPSFEKHLDELAWEAGKRNKYTLAFSDKRIELTCKVLEWDYNEYNVNFGDGNIHAPHALQFENTPSSHVTVSGVEYTIHDGAPLKGTFEIDAPVGGTWSVALIGDYEYFSVEPSSGTIDPSTGMITIKVIPKTDGIYSVRTEDKKVQLTFSVNTAGRDINADSELNYDHCKVVLPKNQ